VVSVIWLKFIPEALETINPEMTAGCNGSADVIVTDDEKLILLITGLE
jgi:hypothetical protein